jgi:Protein of unknown function (DUF3025)
MQALSSVDSGICQALQCIDWQRPWLDAWRERGMRVAQRVQEGASVHAALNREGAVVEFVPQSELPEGTAYEQFIFDTRQVPTRDNLHDFFNGLAWLQFPLIKTRLNHLQAEQIALAGVKNQRGAVRDALTVFDENAAFFSAPPELCEALRSKDWQRLFGALRPLWGQASLVLFGHALLEKLVYPRKPVVAHVLSAWHATQNIAEADKNLSTYLSAQVLAAKPFAPLPVLGVPQWWAENENPAFYEDAKVFRPPIPPKLVGKIAPALEFGRLGPNISAMAMSPEPLEKK